VLVEVKVCGICGSDVHGMDGSTGRRKPPIIMGHEASGVIAEVGAAATTWRVGQPVTFDSTAYCGSCHFCARGAVNLCDNRQVLGVSCDEFKRDGAFAQFVAVPARILVEIPDAVGFEQAAMAEPVAIAVHAAARVPLNRDDVVVVIGAGVIGLLIIEALRARGCGRIIAIDVKRDRLELAARLGADWGISPDDVDAVAEVRKLTGGRGADIVMEAVGLKTTVGWALQIVRKGGAVGLVGNLAPTVELPLQTVVTRELTLLGSCASSGEYGRCLDLIARGIIQVDPLISGLATLEDAADWFERLRAGEERLIKVLVRP
ncbi:MAG: alcohol dehydrogenase catalytic domain-containing protein, partial [Pirellulales bacterium]|nr:alcohol dehydrogenase catalytic domain-containing protein [Pirellulales bacterium]